MNNNVWLISDTHYGHKMLVEKNYRPYDFEQRLDDGLMSVLRKGDTLLHLGDWLMHAGSVAPTHERLRQINEVVGPTGRTILVRGNHDNGSIVKYLSVGWGFVSDGFMWCMYGKRIYFSHKPTPPFYHCDEVGQTTPLFDLNIHGHLHGNDHRGVVNDEYHAEISMELLDYKPISLEKLIQLNGTPQRDAQGKLTVRASI